LNLTVNLKRSSRRTPNVKFVNVRLTRDGGDGIGIYSTTGNNC
jgi:hypothetical protein